jgi:membrane fusion protein (multidrug efflux system)
MQFRHPKRQYEYRPIDGSLRLKDTVALTVFPCCFHVYKINISGELTMLRKTMLVLAVASALVACGKEAKESAKSGGKDANAVQLQIAPEDLLTVQSNALASGPVITGSVQPERKADLRAEVSAVVLQVLKENGEAVKRGDVLVKLDETAIRDSLNSAEAAARASGQALEQAERQLERLKTLRASGMTSMQTLDDAEVRRNSAQSELAAARTRAVLARQQLQRTLVRAPFDGVVSDRKVSAGDTAAIGKELLKVIDPTSMRFEGRVSADKISLVKIGQPVAFRVNGYGDQEFQGTVRRIDPSANDVTRQVEVLVGFVNAIQPKVSGLYGEGRIDSDTKAALMLPEGALVKAGDKAYTWRLKDKALNKAALVIGARDQRTGNYEVKSGLAAGDLVLRTPSSNFKDGQKVDMAPARVATAAAVTPVQGK